jgi:hypothetical protein
MNQLRSLRLIQTFLNTSGYSRCLPLRFPPAHLFCILIQKSILPSPSRSTKSPHFACITTLPKCTIIYIIGGLPLRLCDPACVIGLQTPKRWPMVPWRAAYHFVAQVVQLGLMRRRCLPLFQLSHLSPHQTLIVRQPFGEIR